jgi:RHS repeat-associated protein
LLAEYDGYGACLREYVYIGAKMVAEYHPLDSKYYYYTTDQINSTRVVTDDLGNVVYAAAHDPYGGMQQTWTNTFNPELKFSGKEQDTESGLYYFGARYYDPTIYRFLSPDPVISTSRAVYNPQLWNLYGYCLGNPINMIDIFGMWVGLARVDIYRVPYGWKHPKRNIHFFGSRVGFCDPDYGDVIPIFRDEKEYLVFDQLIFYVHFSIYILYDEHLQFWRTRYENVLAHEYEHVDFLLRHLKPFLDYIEGKYLKELDRLGPEKALGKAKARFERYVQWIKKIDKRYIDDMFAVGYGYWKDINDNWIRWVDDPLMTWMLNVEYLGDYMK